MLEVGWSVLRLAWLWEHWFIPKSTSKWLRGGKKICPVKGTMKGDLWGQHFNKCFVLILCICPIIRDILNWFLWADWFTRRGVEAGLVGNLSAALSLCYLQKVRGGGNSLSTVTGTFCARGASALQRREWKIWFDVFPQIIGFFSSVARVS